MMHFDELCSQFNELMNARTQLDLPLFTPPVVISAQVGSRGVEIAKQIAARLNVPLWDRTVLDQIASQGCLRITGTRSIDTGDSSAVSEIEMLRLPQPELQSIAESEELYERTIDVLLQAGNAVVVSCVSSFLAQSERAMRIRIISPLEVRLANLMEAKKLPKERARAELLQLEEKRTAMMKQYGHDESDPDSYDLILNTGQLSVENCVEISMAAYQERFDTMPAEPVPVVRDIRTRTAGNSLNRRRHHRSRPLDPMHPY